MFFFAALALLLVFDTLWCLQTTFRAFELWPLYPYTLAAAALLTLPYTLTGKRWVETLVLLVAAGLMTANLMYCRTYFNSIPLASYSIASNLGDFLPSVVDSFRWADLILFSIPLAACFLARKTVSVRPFSRARLTASGLVMAGVAVLTGWLGTGADFNKYYKGIKSKCYYNPCTTPATTLAGDMLYQLSQSDEAISPADSMEVASWLAYQAQAAPFTRLPETSAASGRRRSVVLVLCESFESWPIGKSVDGVELTPFLNSLIADSTTFYAPEVVTQVASGRSIDCQLLVNAGMLPMESEIYSMTRCDTEYPTLAKELRRIRGTRSYLLTSDKPTTWNQANISRSFGTDTLVTRDGFVLDEMYGRPAKLSDRSFFRQVTDKMRRGEIWPVGESGYVTLLTYSGHNPFQLPEEVKTGAFGADLPQRLRDYMEVVHYTDGALRILVDYLKSRHDYAETLVVITGDHEGLAGDRPSILQNKRAAGFVERHQLTPLVVLNSPRGGIYPYPMGQADIYPTLLSMLDLHRADWLGMGRSAFDPGKPPFAIVSMTGETVGDTTLSSSRDIKHIREARHVSDMLIKYNLLKSAAHKN